MFSVCATLSANEWTHPKLFSISVDLWTLKIAKPTFNYVYCNNNSYNYYYYRQACHSRRKMFFVLSFVALKFQGQSSSHTCQGQLDQALKIGKYYGQGRGAPQLRGVLSSCSRDSNPMHTIHALSNLEVTFYAVFVTAS